MRLFWQRVIYCIMMLLNIIAILSIGSYLIGLFWIDVTRHEIKSSEIPQSFDGYTILQLSDLHSRGFGNNNSKLLKKIEKEQPDIIVLTGDMVNSKDTDFSTFLQLAETLTKTYPVYYIPGNHELRLPLQKYNQLISKLRQANVTVLTNQTISLFKNGEQVQLIGFNLPLTYYTNQLKNEEPKELSVEIMKQFMGIAQQNTFQILLAHNPLYFDTYAKWGANLTLSGHIHGGMIRIPFIGGLLSPERTFFPKYSAGKYEQEDSTMIVNRGLGNGTINLRIFNHPEISVIQLKSE